MRRSAGSEGIERGGMRWWERDLRGLDVVDVAEVGGWVDGAAGDGGRGVLLQRRKGDAFHRHILLVNKPWYRDGRTDV